MVLYCEVDKVDEVKCAKSKAIECIQRVAHHHRLTAELLGPTILAAPECQIILVSQVQNFPRVAITSKCTIEWPFDRAMLC
jgi:hypothetical protein